jgi:hypothetical protein
VQVEKGESNVNESVQNQITGDTDAAVEEPSRDEDSYHEFKRIMRIASVARVLSWISLGIGVLLSVVRTFAFIAAVSNVASAPSDVGYIVSLAWPAIIDSFLPILNSGVFFVVLQAVSEGIFVLLYMENNTRRTADAARKRSE